MKLKALALSLLVSGAIPVIAQAGEYSNGDRVYAIFGRHESAAYVRGGNIVQAGDSNSKVEFDSCIPECYKWMSNYSLYGSKGKAQEIVKEMDEGHTSFTEGAGMAVGLLALLGLAAAMSDSEDSSDKSNYSSSKPDSKPVYSQDDGTGRMMYYRGDILELKYNGVKYNIPKDYYNNNKDKRKDLFRTLLNTESMEDDERQYWLYGLPTIGEDKVDRLTEILVTEEKKLAKLSNEFTSEYTAIIKKGEISPEVDLLQKFGRSNGVFINPLMVRIPGGRFVMGDSVLEGDKDELPIHLVNISTFYASKYEVTFAEWDLCYKDGGCSHNPSDSNMGRGTRPVVDVNKADAKEYIRWINSKTGATYRLPSEAEWEYMARAGTTTSYFWGNEIGQNNANCKACGSKWDFLLTAPVGSFSPNAFGLYDTHGNVWEWTADCYHLSYEGAPNDGSAWDYNCNDLGTSISRGGAYRGSGDFASIRSSFRGGGNEERSREYGFRLVSD